MKKFAYYSLLIIIVVLLLPLLIVRSCSFTVNDKEEEVPGIEPTKISVFIASENKTEQMLLEEYIKGVLAREMPADFAPEALKAQAVAARTYAYGRMIGLYKPSSEIPSGADISTDPSTCQAWMSKAQAYKNWGILNAAGNWNRIEKAVTDTKDIIMVCSGKVVNPLFHSNSGGKTENSEEVWDGVAEPYLRSVVSEGEDRAPDYKSIITVKQKDFINTIRKKYPDFTIKTKDIMTGIKILEHTTGGRVKTIRVGNTSFKGTEFRTLFSLRSANFSISKNKDGSLKITCLGYGHGVGMSQWGANYLAKKGQNFEYILKYYYKGVELDTIDSYKLRQNN